MVQSLLGKIILSPLTAIYGLTIAVRNMLYDTELVRATSAIPKMVGKHPDLQTILLDDAFQHRSITPGLNILLTNYDLPFTKDYLLPSGRLREWRSAYSRADIIVVTKCPTDITEADRERLIADIKPMHHQQIFFSQYKYQHPYSFYNPKQRIQLDPNLDVILISAIANTKYLLDYLHSVVGSVHHMDYEDHHLFSDTDIDYIKTVYQHRDTPRKIILTTEKDAMRLDLHRQALGEAKLPIFVLPAEVDFLFGQQPHFDHLMRDYLLNFKI